MKHVLLTDNYDFELINDAWDSTESFVVLDAKQGRIPEYLLDGYNKAPREYKKNHFAIMTSGSTGKPKLVIAPKSNSEALVRALHEAQESDIVQSTIALLPLSYSFSFINQWLWAREFNRKLIPTKGTGDLKELSEILENTVNGKLCLIGAQVPILLNAFVGRFFPGIVRIHFAGGKFPFHSIDHLKKIFPNAKIFNNYGCTEAMPRLSVISHDKMSKENDIGNPLPSITFKLENEHRLVFKSPKFGAVAYIDQNGFHRITEDDWVDTGDLGACNSTGNEWRIFGRSNAVFKRYGEKIVVSELLNDISIDCRQDLHYYLDKDSHGETAWVLAMHPHPGDEDVKKILKLLSSKYRRQMWPIRIESVENTPFLPNGKVDIKSLSSSELAKVVHWQQKI